MNDCDWEKQENIFELEGVKVWLVNSEAYSELCQKSNKLKVIKIHLSGLYFPKLLILMS